jgi:integrase
MKRSVRRILDGCRFVYPVDLDAEAVKKFLAKRRAGFDAGALPPGPAEFRKRELAELPKVKPSAVPFLVKRHKLEAIGTGKARRYPRSTAEALIATHGRGAGEDVEHVPGRAQAVRPLAGRCEAPGPARGRGADPLDRAGQPGEDPRHARNTPLTKDELARPIAAAESSAVVFRGLAGRDLAMIYRLAVETGYRAEELSKLRPVSFAIAGDLVEAVLPATATKNGKPARQPLGPSAELLRAYLAGRSADRPVFPGAWWQDAAEMIRLDQDVAGIPYVVEAPEGTSFRDFHNLRHTMVALLDENGETFKEAMQLARHSDPRLTAKVYGRASRERLAESGPAPPDGARASPGCRRDAGRRDSQGQNRRTRDDGGAVEPTARGRAEHRENSASEEEREPERDA